MTRLATRCAAAFSLVALALPAAAQNTSSKAAARVEPVSKFIAGGIPVIYKRITANDVIAVQLYLEGGSAALTPAMAGIEHLLGEAATHGTAKYSKDRFAALATSTGTNISATVGYDYTVLSAQAVRQNWDAAWDLFTQAALHPTFPADEV